jgi:putative ABC transport system permease protein
LANHRFNGRVVALDAQIRSGVARPLLMLEAAAGLIWLIACANIANLMLTRAVDRQRDSALRVSLGATTRHLMRDWLAESACSPSAAPPSAFCWRRVRFV